MQLCPAGRMLLECLPLQVAESRKLFFAQASRAFGQQDNIAVVTILREQVAVSTA